MNSLDIIVNFEGESSYKRNNFGILLYSLVRSYKPKNCMEIGVLNGYSTISIACALRDNRQGSVKAIDLFEDYKYKNNSFEYMCQNIKKFKLNDYISLIKGDIFSEIDRVGDDFLDFVHFDISNDGNKLKNFIDKYYDKMKQDCIFVFEGGSSERDEVNWMQKYDKKPINCILEQSFFKNRFDFLVLNPFPSITICKKKVQK